ncbi:hypothetical protein CHGG_04709 [Chaetomium globosum CBS 148.51]|uniref:Major facilitator superfamily (MFS) profile domain-containing protein n=1 Tax=Chaetomium globosum (strain ATCC 6205 / CBS 148.51 / DSM 1962 / NBRC 6347 / NRRL 1970) TaxID=306901 RepID=Q2H0I7_CHAGB|nr:uncharacterized protein CHGG_04709 [Chaetomium globosum CBS 148.51]EAQ88090.1 hypothetical protein CHGG_04709 [Chaetomium globosum CBS 148.51]
MTSTEGWDGSDSSGARRRTDGSENGYLADVGETTSLLGAGARSSSNHGSPDETNAPNQDGSWGDAMILRRQLPLTLLSIIDLVCKHYFADRSATDPDFTFAPVIPGGNNRQCFIPEVQRSVATFTLVLNVTIGMLSSLTAPKLGSLSDRYGRKRMMIICSMGGIMSEIITIIAAKYPETIGHQWLLLGGFFDGLTGSFTAGSVLSHAYTSDCTPPSKRGVAIGYLHSCLFTGLAIGPLIAGYLVEWTGSLLSIFYILLGCHISFVLFMAFVIPESLSRKQQLLAREKHARAKEALVPTPECTGLARSRVPLGRQISRLARSIWTTNPLAPLDILFPTGPGTGQLRRNFLILAFIDMVVLGTAMSAGTVIVMYVEYMFEWGNLESSRFVSMTSMVRVIVLVGILPLINYLFRKRPAARRRREALAHDPTSPPPREKNHGADKLDLWILRVALVSDVIGITGYVFARSSAAFVACAIVMAFGGLGSATIQAAVTKHVPPQRVGQMLGAIGLLHSLARIGAPIVFNQLYAATVEGFPQAFFVMWASMFALALGASFFLKPNVYMAADDEVSPSPPARPSSSANAVRRDALEDDALLP